MTDEHETPATDDAAAVEQIRDNDDYIERRRLKEIYDAKEAVRSYRREIEMMLQDPDYPHMTPRRGRQMLRVAVEDFLVAIEPLARDSDNETVQRYWDQERLGRVRCEPPESLRSGASGSLWNDYQEIIEPATPQFRNLEGLKSLLDTRSPLRFEFAATARTRSATEPVEVTDVAREPVSKQILTEAMRHGTAMLAELGVEAELTTNEGGASFDYEEIAPGRLKE